MGDAPSENVYVLISVPSRRSRSRHDAQTPKSNDIDRVRVQSLRRRLLAWAAREGRRFFWREPGLTPYEALVTEILLTKTRAELVATTARVVLARYSSIRELSHARAEDLEELLYPLGLYRKRARGLIACAAAVVERHKGSVPSSIAELVELPAVGRYAAHAIACVVYEQAVPVLDANVARIYQRVFSLPPPPERLAIAHDLWSAAEQILPKAKAKAFNWAILDLGGTVCTAKQPRCDHCPLASNCDMAGLPSRPAKLRIRA